MGKSPVKRILVLGCSGAGKSTLARQIGALTGIPVVHLDQHYWRPGWREPEPEIWERQLAALLREPRWVMDGNFGRTLALRLLAADTVIFLDFSTWRCLVRVLRRVASTYGQTRSDMAPGCVERLDWAFLGYVCRYRRHTRPRHLAALRQFTGTRIILRRPAEVAAFVAALAASGGDRVAPQCRAFNPPAGACTRRR